MNANIRSVLILGYGREGKSVHRYLHQHYPYLKIGIADQNKIQLEINAPAKLHWGKNYLQSLYDYDLIIRSPGIPLQLAEIQQAQILGKKISSVTKIFFSECPGLIIGVTGTLGKSTTASLIAAILSEKYPDVRLAGNIGIPMLDRLDGASKKTIFVLELSSFQLEDLDKSPQIAVLLNIVPEHLDRHQTFTAYVKAKTNIIKHQTSKDFLVFNPKHQILAQLTSQASGQKVNFGFDPHQNLQCFFHQNRIFIKKRRKIIPLINRNEIALLGKGNTENIMAAITVALLLKVPLTNTPLIIF